MGRVVRRGALALDDDLIAHCSRPPPGTDDAGDSIRQAEPEVPRQLSGELVLDLVHRDRVAELARRAT